MIIKRQHQIIGFLLIGNPPQHHPSLSTLFDPPDIVTYNTPGFLERITELLLHPEEREFKNKYNYLQAASVIPARALLSHAMLNHFLIDHSLDQLLQKQTVGSFNHLFYRKVREGRSHSVLHSAEITEESFDKYDFIRTPSGLLLKFEDQRILSVLCNLSTEDFTHYCAKIAPYLGKYIDL